ncbi:MAG TPA: pitrilysin family protein, partial [Chitinispirillaceae bacterium]|nr:pitrilysin family protein [Chitinispirillaceae bacterium]
NIYNRSLKFFITVLTFVCAVVAQNAVIPPHPKQLKYDSLRWSVPSGEQYRTVLQNGLRTYIASDSSLPLVELSGIIRYGALLDPDDKVGIASLMGTLIRSGGTEKISSDSLDNILGQKAINISFSISDDMCNFKATFLSEYTDTSLALLKQMLFNPAYEQKKIDQHKAIYIESIKHRFDNPGPTLSFAYDKHMYQSTKNSRFASEKTLAAITREDLLKTHKKYFKSGNMILAVSGTFDRNTFIKKLETLFPKSNMVTDTTFPVVQCKPSLKSLVVNKNISQAYVRLGIPLFKRPFDDFYPVMALNEIFGGGSFTSRLSSKIRSDEGLTYSIYSVAESNYTMQSTWYITFFTTSETFSKATGLIFSELDTIVKYGVTEKEVSDVKSVFLSELPSMFRSPFDIVSNYAMNEYNGRSPDHYQKYVDAIKKLSKSDLDSMARKYLVKENFSITAVGDTSKILKTNDTLFDITKKQPQKVINFNTLKDMP